MVRRLTGAQIKRYDRAVYATLITIGMVVVAPGMAVFTRHEKFRLSR
ncbi:MAG: hypothetical protein WCB15_10460 [Desulfobacterales bacterium]|jgi:hypothetical protein